jgi:hypothetical protein
MPYPPESKNGKSSKLSELSYSDLSKKKDSIDLNIEEGSEHSFITKLMNKL